MGWTLMFQSIQVQSSVQSPFSNVDLVWKNGFRHGAQNKVAIEAQERVSKFLEGERGDMQTLVEWNKHKI